MERMYLKIKCASGERYAAFREGILTIGRLSLNKVVLDDAMASRRHCVIKRTPDGYLLQDLQSPNGTKLNGQSIQSAPLHLGDIITIGKTELTLVDTLGEPDELEVLEDEVAPPDDPISVLRRMADALLDRSFDVDAISLINTRGKPLLDPDDDAANESENVALLRLTLLICFRSYASDIHLEPRADDFLLRIRVDGNLLDLLQLSRETGIKFSAVVKVLSDLDTTQRTIVQEGHFATHVTLPAPPGQQASPAALPRRVDYRISFVPTLYGQKLVVRVFDTANAPLWLEDLHMPAPMAAEVKKFLTKSTGIIMVCGPTGSGKTTTLYSLLRSSGTTKRNIVTIEDPVEVQIKGTTQLPVDDSVGKGFAALLRSVLRQDPDVIMVGEIRDAETAKIALQAAMTGHMVLSTLHTRDTVGTIFRLLDLGIEPYIVAQGVDLIIAQRLVRNLCKVCRQPYLPTAEERRKLGPAGESVARIYGPKGCPKCLGTGYSGRRAFFECLHASEQLGELILQKPNPADVHRLLKETPFVPLLQAGYQLVAQGLTSMTEVDHVVGN